MNDGLSSRNKLISGFNVLRVSVADPLTGFSPFLKKMTQPVTFQKICFQNFSRFFFRIYLFHLKKMNDKILSRYMFWNHFIIFLFNKFIVLGARARNSKWTIHSSFSFFFLVYFWKQFFLFIYIFLILFMKYAVYMPFKPWTILLIWTDLFSLFKPNWFPANRDCLN